MKNNIYHLIEKYLDGTITPAEEETLMAWYQDHNEADVEWLSENVDEEEEVRARMLLRLQQQVNVPVTRHATAKRRWYYIPAAACILVILGLAGYFYYPQQHRSEQPANIANAVNTIVPGSNKAILMLDNGDKVVLADLV